MSYSRRDFLGLSAKLMLASTAFTLPQVSALDNKKIKAIAFDAFPIFDPRPIFGLVKKLYPEKGQEFSIIWRTRIFEYTWLLTSAGKYEDFWTCIDNALVYTARHLHIDLTPANHQLLMNAFLSIKAFPDVKPVLSELKQSGIKLAFLSNMTEKMLNTGISNSGLEGYFDHILSTDSVKTFKPDPKAYQLAVDAFELQRDEIAFAAFASWDAVGAKWFGYPTFWVNRLKFPAENMGTDADGTGTTLAELAMFVKQRG
ncbi:haloacid dehalogenase type II [Sulfuriflexus mobilis]|uniref:haloacid dehalogenase type II n=1 Tax=Sulfuriflexus mobilis TaxID=1811807 RepID=UPI000F8338FF|nr:haloacid dehalogenase type II [Sulfuriflexus mobilis]